MCGLIPEPVLKHRVELLRWEKSPEIIKWKCNPSPTSLFTTNPSPHVSHPHIFNPSVAGLPRVPWQCPAVLCADAALALQQCCDCCSLGLRLRSEGKSCQPNINLGYPCSHVMLSCCQGGDHLAHPEIRRHPQPLPTVTPEKGECPCDGSCSSAPHTPSGGSRAQEHSCFPLRASTAFLLPKAGWEKVWMFLILHYTWGFTG